MKRMRNQEGFTLVELMVVVVIIGILASLAIPKFMDASVKAKCSEVPPNLAAYETANIAYVHETGAAGLSTAIIFDAPTGSANFTYADNGAGTYEGLTSAVLGKLDAGSGITTTVDNAATITRALKGTDADEALYWPNW